jgi:ribosomal protein S18 acetylase RimI-like enzyme
MLASRLYEDERDLLQMYAMLMEARSLADDWRYTHVGELAFHYFMIACHLDPRQHICLWLDADKLVAYAFLGEDPAFDVQVFPGYEGGGIEEEALIWAEGRIAELRQRDIGRWGGSLLSCARQDDARRIAFLERHGFRYRGDFSEVNMLRSLDESIPVLSVPDGYQVREVAEAGEYARRAAAHREVWLPWTDGDISDADYARFMRLPGYQRDLDIVAVSPGGEIAAFANGWIDPLNRIGDFGPVGARPAYRRQGLTRLALLEGLRRMQERGMQRACVSTNIANLAAQKLYESVGFEVVNRYLDYGKAI